MAVVVRTAHLRKRLLSALEILHLDYRVVPLSGGSLDRTERHPQDVWCVEAGLTIDLPYVPRACIMLLPPLTTPRLTPVTIPPGGAVSVRTNAVTPATVLMAVLKATAETVSQGVLAVETFRLLPRELVVAFLREPSAFHRLSDICRAFRKSRDQARKIVRSTKRFDRAEHLFTALRSVMWAYLTSEGLLRSAVEEYLSIDDRSDFRRACHRARVQAPKVGLLLEDFSL